MSAYDTICRLEARRQELYALTSRDPYAHIRDEVRDIEHDLAQLWHRRRCEMRQATDATPESYQQDLRGLNSITIKTDPATTRSRQAHAARAARRAGAVLVAVENDD